MRLKKSVLLIGIILVGVGVSGTIYFTYFAGNYTVRSHTLISADGTQLASLVYEPTDISGTVPGIVVCHGFMANKQAMQGISLELVKCGFVVIAIDFRGHGESDGNLDPARDTLIDDVYAAVQYLKSLSYVDSNNIGLVGHSMGGQAVMRTAIKYQAEINATVSIGMVGMNDSSYAINGTAISNLLIAIGGLEELITEEQALTFLQNATGYLYPNVQAGVLYGKHEYGNATKLFIAPRADHILEITDTEIINETRTWFRDSFKAGDSPPITEHFRQLFILLAAIGSGVIFFAFVAYIRPIAGRNEPDTPSKVDDPSSRKKILPYIGGYWLATLIALILIFPLSQIFSQNLNFIMGNFFVGLFMGYAIGLFLVFYLIHRFVDKDARPFFRRIKEQVSNNFSGAIIFGLITFFYSFGTLIAILHWSMFDLLPTTREIGATLMIALMLFPYAFLDQLYIRNLQSHVRKGRIKESIKVVLLISIVKIALFIPLLFFNLGLASLIIIVLLIGFPFLEILATWIYMHSGRNILSPAIYVCLILSWVLVAVMPFGNYAYSFL